MLRAVTNAVLRWHSTWNASFWHFAGVYIVSSSSSTKDVAYSPGHDGFRHASPAFTERSMMTVTTVTRALSLFPQ